MIKIDLTIELHVNDWPVMRSIYDQIDPLHTF